MRLTALLILIGVEVAFGQTTQPLRKGTNEFTFQQRSPLSAIEIQHARYGIPATPDQAYDIARERFSITVPDAFDPETLDQWGVLVWCNAGKSAQPPGDWEASLATKKLIAIGPFNVGNDRAVGIRIGLVVDAAFNLLQRYPNLAPHRIYVSGVSGGAKVATMAAMAFPEVFDGAICCAGVNWYKDTPVPDQPGKFWQAAFRKPPLPTFAAARDHVGFVLTTGVNDGNYLPMKTMYEKGFLPEEFKYARFFDVPDLGHRTPPAATFEQAIDYLDSIPKTREKNLPAATPATQPTPRLAATTLPGSAVPSKPTPAARLLALARNYRVNKMPDKAKAKLEQLLKDYPDTEEAKVARTMLRELAGPSGSP